MGALSASAANNCCGGLASIVLAAQRHRFSFSSSIPQRGVVERLPVDGEQAKEVHAIAADLAWR